MNVKCAICPEPVQNKNLINRALLLCNELKLPVVLNQNKICKFELLLLVTTNGLGLKVVQGKKKSVKERTVVIDWCSLDTRSVAGRHRSQPLLRAVRGKKKYLGIPLILDGTAGFGEDSWLLAALGHRIIACERNRLVYAILRDAQARAGITMPFAARRIKLMHQDLYDILQKIDNVQQQNAQNHNCLQGQLPRPDIIYLDPMYPGYKRRKTAERKPIQVLRMIVGDDLQDEERIMRSSLAVARNRVVVKRPIKAECFALNLCQPVHQVFGRSVRYDIYVNL